MAKKRIFDLAETKGSFQFSGVVTGVEKDKFFEEKNTKTNKLFRSVNFGTKVNGKGDAVYTYLNGMERDKVYYCRKADKDKGIDAATEEVQWKDRYNFSKDGFRMIGVNVGVKKKLDSTGTEVNDKKVLEPFDACAEIHENLKDDQSVFMRGKTEFSTYNNKHNVRFIPNQISLCKPIDFSAEDFKENAKFTQVIVYTGVSPNEDKSKFIVSAKIVTYDSIEDAEFVIADEKLARMFNKKLKPYTAIKVWGDVAVSQNVEKVESKDDCWGESNDMDKQSSPTTRELVITGADPASIDTDTYSEDKIEQAIAKVNASKQAKKDFDGDKASTSSSDDGWGFTNTSDAAGDEDEPW